MGNGVPPTRSLQPTRTIRRTVFQNVTFGLERREENDGYNLIIYDPADNHTYVCPFNDDIKDELVEQLTGVTLPKIDILRGGH